MREDFLYYLWTFKKYDSSKLLTASGEKIVIMHPGRRNESSGPDFFNARIQIDDQLWAGNVEMHLRSADWYWHQHEQDPSYDNVILHVVWEHDADIFRNNNSVIPTLILKDRVDDEVLENYHRLLEVQHLTINCENDFDDFADFELTRWKERLFFERLENKAVAIFELLKSSEGDWEAVLYQLLLKNFGLNVNGEAFMSLAHNIPFKVIQKIAAERENLEAAFLGMSGLIKGEDAYSDDLKERFEYLQHKFKLNETGVAPAKFFRLRPDNFPTIRLAQLAALFFQKQKLFSEVIKLKNREELAQLFKIEVSEYWQTHYNFGTAHQTRKKNFSKNFLDLIMINTIVPLQFAWNKYHGNENHEQIIDLISSIPSEKNAAISIFEQLKPEVNRSAFDSQALLELKKNYCDKNRCLQCELGNKLLNRSKEYH